MKEQSGKSSIHSGQCACGNIRYSMAGEPLFTHACHCTECQRRSGSAFCLSMFVMENQLRLAGDVPATYKAVSSSGATKEISYCRACGTMLYGRALRSPNIVWLRPGTLDDASWIRPQAHIWTKSKQPWVALPADVALFDTSYERNITWPAESLERLTT